MFKSSDIPQLSPYLTVKNSAKSIEFYHNAFGFTAEEVMKDDKGVPQHVYMRKDEAYIMFSSEGAYGTTKKAPVTLGIEIPINIYIYCDDTDELYKQAISKGTINIVEPHDGFWGDRFCVVRDLDGYEWGFATLLKASSKVAFL